VALIPLNPPMPVAFARRTAWNGPAALKYWHLVSLDAPSVAAAWACAFAWAAQVRVARGMVAVLALVVWVIYITDRLLDARAGLDGSGRHNLQERHWFHWRHRRALGVLAGIAAVTAAWMILSRLQAAALGRDSLMGLATLAYFTGVHGSGVHGSGVHGRGLRSGWVAGLKERVARVVSRELIVGVIFSAGCLVPALPPAQSGVVQVCMRLAVPAAAFAALAWLNVKAIGCWEAAAAKRSGREPGVRRIAFLLVAVCGGCGIATEGLEPRVGLLLALVAVSSLLLAWLDGMRARLDAVTLRAAADLVLLTPVLLLIPPGVLAR
jgi:hypothetical protein